MEDVALEVHPELSFQPTALPEKLSFLSSPQCNPDLDDPEIRKIGGMRNAKLVAERATMAQRRSALDCWRRVFRVVVYSFAVQTLVFLVIAFDCVLTIITFTAAYNPDQVIYDVADWLVVIVLSLDVLGRFFVEGCAFLRGKLNVFELLLVPFTIVEVFVLKDSNLPLPLLRVLRPAFRGVRLIRVTLRAIEKMNQYSERLRRQLSGDRIRFTQDGFDLDLAYINPQIIAMSMPAVGKLAWLHNSERDVARFLNERHGNKYLVVNVAKEVQYPTEGFFHRCLSFPIAKDSVPSLADLFEVCGLIDEFLKADPDHVVAVHSKFAQGRTSLLIVALLLYRGVYRSPTAAIPFYEHIRVIPEKLGVASTQTIDCASQRRFLEYFAHVCQAHHHNRQPQSDRKVTLKTVRLHGLPMPQSIELRCYTHEGTKVQMLQAHSKCDADEEMADFAQDDAKAFGTAKKVIDQSTFDNVLAGTSALRGQQPFLSSMAEDGQGAQATLVARPARVQDVAFARWDAFNAELTGEFRFELHRRKKGTVQADDLEKSEQAKSRSNSKSRSTFASSKGRRNKEDQLEEQIKVFDDGLLLSAWFHTTYLEHDEPSRDTASRRRTAQKMVIVELDRFQLDKAANAPALASLSSALKLELEFEVGERRDVRSLADADIDKGYKISSTIHHSDPCSMEWLTWVMKKIWPSFESGFKSMFESTVNSLQGSLPPPLHNISLASFSLGSASPIFGPSVASSRNIDGLEVQLDIDLDYTTSTNIVIDVGIATFGISSLSIKGTLSVKFKPILPELPVFASIQLLFLNPPKIDLSFGGSLEFANSSLVKSKIFGAINKGLADVLVLPNVLTINWADPDNLNDSAVSFDNLMPCAVVRIQVKEGRNLISSSALTSSPTAFAKIDVGGHSAETSAIQSTANPSWREEFDVMVYDERQYVSLEVYDFGLARMASKIGQLEDISVATIAASGSSGYWGKLEHTPGGAASEVLLRAIVYDLHADPTMLDPYVSSEGSGQMTETSEAECFGPKCLQTASAKESDAAVALLVCQVHGGRLSSTAKEEPSSLSIEVCLGQARKMEECSAAAETAQGTLSEKTMRIIESLAGKSVEPKVIADALGEDVEEVIRIIRKHGWNLACHKKICSIVRPSDLAGTKSVNLRIISTKSKETVATCLIPLHTVLHTAQVRHCAVVTCYDSEGNAFVELDLETRLYALAVQEITH
eukprot:TRINITY_DN6566_c0_g2_i1.p1 TRINITY_DN6566_c0_g2~~TRINITY_DN6566_c0_g2_i1.p1  ORF type:complete len:1214 (-),score=201.41 TRINITY_DN6566_c0_g2_i1:217-3858(-)